MLRTSSTVSYTHLDVYKRQVHIITGHARAGKALDIDFEALVRTRGTLVFLMGISTLPRIVSGPVSYTHLDVYKRQALESRGYTGQIATLPGTYTTGRWCYPAAAAIAVSQGLILLAERGRWI